MPPTEYETLSLKIELDDAATAMLKQISREVERLGGITNLPRLRKDLEEVQRQTKGLPADTEKLNSGMLNFTRGAALAGLPPHRSWRLIRRSSFSKANRRKVRSSR